MSKRLLFTIPRLSRHFRHYQAVRLASKNRFSSSIKLLVASATGFIAYKSIRVYAYAGEKDTSVIDDADKLYNGNGNLRLLYEYLKRHESSTNADVLWRLGRAARDLALKSPDVTADEKKALVYESFECSKRALEADETNFAAHKWFAITMGDVGDYEGVKVKISNAFIIKDHLQRATELNPKDATTLHCLGMWCFTFADMPRWQRYVAGVMFATPPTSNYQEAADYFMQAERVDSGFYSVNFLMLGKSYMKMGDKKKAMLYFDKTITFPIATDEDRQAKSEAESLMKEMLGR